MNQDQALRESEYRYRNLFQAMAASFWECDFAPVGAMLRQLKATGVKDYTAHFERNPDFVRAMMAATRVLDVNDQTLVLFGRGNKDELLGPSDRYWPESSNAVYAASVVAAVTAKPNFSAETKLRRLDGSEFDAHFTVCFPPESVAKGTLLIGVIDISERKQATERLQRLQADLAHAARVSMLGELAASIAHEVNQPLAAIAMNASACLRWLDRPTPDLDEVRALAKNIVADAQRAGEIIARIRGIASHREPVKVPLPTNEVIREGVQCLEHELQAQGVTLMLDLGPAVPAVVADRVLLQQVVANLVINAIQAMQNAQSRKREIGVASRVAPNQTVEIAVRDTGPGIAPEHFNRLFQSFFTTKASGMGLGLSVSKTIVESLGGQIAARNSANGGAQFLVTLPTVP